MRPRHRGRDGALRVDARPRVSADTHSVLGKACVVGVPPARSLPPSPPRSPCRAWFVSDAWWQGQAGSRPHHAGGQTR